MVKSGLGLFAARRKSAGNVMEDREPIPVPPVENTASADTGGGFRVMSHVEAEIRKKEEKRRAQEKSASKFRPFSGFGSANNKARNHSFEDESPSSSKRDSKSSNGTNSSRPYNNGQFGSTSTLPSSADTDSNDNIFAIPRPLTSHHNSSPSALSMGATKKQLPILPKSPSRTYGGEPRTYGEPTSPVAGFGRVRAMTSSSYASTAKPPTLDADMNFGSTSFDDMFSGLERKQSPETMHESPGRSLLAGKRTFQAEPIKIDNELEVEEPLTSWNSQGSADNLMSSPRSPDNDSPPPVPPHKFSKYTPVASHSPELYTYDDFVDTDATTVRQSAMAQKSIQDSSPEQLPKSLSSSVPSLQTPLSSRSASNNTTPKAVLRAGALSSTSVDDDYEDLFAPTQQKKTPVPRPSAAASIPTRPAPSVTGEAGRRVMTHAEFEAQRQRQETQPPEESSDEDDYEDEEEAEERAQQEAIARRKKQQMSLARETMRRTITAPGNANIQENTTEPFSMGFPSETSMNADEWEDEDIPLGILAQHGFPSRNRLPSQPANAMPSYLPNSTPTLPDRPASAGAMSSRASQAFRPAFARGLPDDPYAAFIGGGLVRPTNRESMGFNRGPASVAGDVPGGMPMPMLGYQEPPLTAPSLVEQIHMRDMSKKKYNGGASSKTPQGGPFTGQMGMQMNGPGPNAAQTRMSQMPMLNGMNGMNGMGPMGMGMNMMGQPMGMPMMGMNQMPNQMQYPMPQNDVMAQNLQLQQMLAQQQYQLQQMQAQSQSPQNSRMSTYGGIQSQDPRMSTFGGNQPDPRMSMYSNNFGSGFLNVPSGPTHSQRPMSIMSQQPQRPFSTPGHMAGGLSPAPAPMNGYTPSIAPSERSNIGLSARYRPVATHQDADSTVSSAMTLQASSGAPQNKTVKGILKKKEQAAQDEDEDSWAKMNARKSRFIGNNTSRPNELADLVRGVDGL